MTRRTPRLRSRRDFLRLALGGTASVWTASLATGLPPSFLLYGRTARANEGVLPTYLVLLTTSAGDPMNTNAPGCYGDPAAPDDPLHHVDHPTTAELGSGVDETVSVDGQFFGATHFETPDLISFGSRAHLAPSPYGVLPEALRARLGFLHHATLANAHPENANVLKLHGAVRGPDGTGVESLPSAIAQETAPVLGTLLSAPVAVGGTPISFEGANVRMQAPDDLKALFGGELTSYGVDAARFAVFRDHAIDRIYRAVQRQGTHAQKRFLDDFARSRSGARALGDELGPLLEPIEGDGQYDQVTAAVALLRQNVTPVVTLQFPFGGDNHQDADLAVEVQENISGIDGIRALWSALVAAGLEDRVTFATLSVFGRTLRRNSAGGRDHESDHHVMTLFGPRVAPGVTGGLEPDRLANDGSIRTFGAKAIGDVARADSFSSAGKTLAAAVGVSDEAIARRIVGGRVLSEALRT